MESALPLAPTLRRRSVFFVDAARALAILIAFIYAGDDVITPLKHGIAEFECSSRHITAHLSAFHSRARRVTIMRGFIGTTFRILHDAMSASFQQPHFMPRR